MCVCVCVCVCVCDRRNKGRVFVSSIYLANQWEKVGKRLKH